MKTCSLVAGGVAFVLPATVTALSEPRTVGARRLGELSLFEKETYGATSIALLLGAGGLYAFGRKDCALAVAAGSIAASLAMNTRVAETLVQLFPPRAKALP